MVIGLVLRLMLNDAFLYYIDCKVNDKAREQIVKNIEQGNYDENETITFYNKLFHTHEEVYCVHYTNQGDKYGVFFSTFGFVDESTGFLYELEETPPKKYKIYNYTVKTKYNYGDKWLFVLLQ